MEQEVTEVYEEQENLELNDFFNVDADDQGYEEMTEENLIEMHIEEIVEEESDIEDIEEEVVLVDEEGLQCKIIDRDHASSNDDRISDSLHE